MNKKAIRLNIERKVESWLGSIEDQDLARDIRRNVIVTGGCITSMLLGDKVNDYDIYIRDFDVLKRVSQYYVDKFNTLYNEQIRLREVPSEQAADGLQRVEFYVKSAGVAGSVEKEEDRPEYRFFEDPNIPEEEAGKYLEILGEHVKETKNKAKEKPESYLPVFMTTNAVTLTDRVQLIIRFHGPAEEIHKNFDFVHCTNYWDAYSNKLVLTEASLMSTINKQLVYTNSLYPIAALLRVRKFITRGWAISAGQLLKICYAINELDLKNPNVLREQLVGMDFAYFKQLLDALIAPDGQVRTSIDSIYVCEIIDRMDV